METNDLELFETEWAILQVVWKKEPCSAPQVQEALATKKEWAYTTVKTMMDRMVKKELLLVEKVRNLNLYSTTITQQQAQHSEITRTIKRAFQGALTPMMQFMVENEEIPNTEFDKLEELIRIRKKQNQ